ncbi:hypothetical protein L596_004535 [Steinernema carpocapsae]|uniref:Uncharacterized protein n=1 Tax=Steinernema carpocapsae TaxID=34508 RepID=A0A4U8UX59_STECR|nr:hypothetical protein L596_004535 [Steinernema carpocapsae]
MASRVFLWALFRRELLSFHSTVRGWQTERRAEPARHPSLAHRARPRVRFRPVSMTFYLFLFMFVCLLGHSM